MKSIVIVLCALCVSLISCKSSKDILFCEGVSGMGEGVRCGSEFEEGAISVVVKSKEQWGVKQIKLQVYELRNRKYEKLETIYSDVNPEKNYAHVNISFYNEGRYKVRAYKSGSVIAEGDLQVTEQ